MGKIKKERLKYHQLVKNKNETDQETKGLSYEGVAGDFDIVNLPSESKIKIDSNPFSGINIDINNLKTSLEDDAVSVRSIAKSLKYDANGKLLKKTEKLKLRHDLFMQRLSLSYKPKEKSKRKKKKKGGVNIIDTNNVIDDLPQLVKIEAKKKVKDKVKTVKVKGIQKTKKRHQNMLEDIAAFRKIISDPAFKANSINFISDNVHNKLVEEKKSHNDT